MDNKSITFFCCSLSIEPPIEFKLRGETIPADSQLDFKNIGLEENALHCVTPFQNCCKHNRRGEFYDIRDGSAHTLPLRRDNMILYRNRGPSMVRLNKRDDQDGDIAGLYRCCLPDGCGEEKCIEITLV